MNENKNTTPHIENHEKTGNKNQTFFDKVKNSIRTTLAATGIAASTLSGSVSGGTVSSLVTIPTAATVVTALSASSCNPDPIPVPPTPEKDTVAPTITIHKPSVDITGGKTLRIDGNKLYIGDVLVASRSDNKTQNCKASLKFNGQTISSGATLSEEGVLEIVVTDDAGNSKSAEVKCNITNGAPQISVLKPEVDVSTPKKVDVKNNNTLYIGEETIASWSDDRTQNCNVSMKIGQNEIKSGDTLKDAGELIITITDEEGKSSSANIKLNVINNAPEITVKKSEVNIFGGVKANITDSQLLFDDEVIAEWKDDRTEKCKAVLKLGDQEIKSGDVINQAGTATLTITDGEGKSSEASITLENKAIYGLDNLQNLSMQVDQEVNLLSGITFADGASLVKVEIVIDEHKSTVSDPAHFVPEYPGSCSIIFTVEDKNGVEHVDGVDNLEIKGIEYKAVQLETVDVINSQYAWFDNINETSQSFIYPHVLVSYLASERYREKDNEYRIIAGREVTSENYPAPNVGNPKVTPKTHADFGWRRIKTITPKANILSCGGNRDRLEKYVKNNPDKIFYVSCAAEYRQDYSPQQLQQHPEYNSLKRLLDQENVIICVAISNKGSPRFKTIAEHQPPVSDGLYNSASVSSSKNNKITVTGYGFAQPQDRDFIFEDGIPDCNQSRLPRGFDKSKGNIVIPFSPLVDMGINTDDRNSQSSFATAALSGALGNRNTVIRGNNPGATANGAMTIIANNYLRGERPRYKYTRNDTEWLEGNCDRYFLETDKVIENEVLHKKDIDKLQFNADISKLPSYPGICYIGKGIQFQYNGQRYNMTKENEAKFLNIVANNDIKWRFNKEAWKKMGGKGSANFEVYVLDKSGKKIPDIKLSVTKPVN